ncbi:MAG: hypothetical protein U1E60_23060 [Reyranellaceae bacterium]
MSDPYDIFDPVLEPWAAAHGFTLHKLYRDDSVRTVWPPSLRNPETVGQGPQLWLGWPIVDGGVDVCVAVGRWSHRAPATLQTMRAVLDQELNLLAARCTAPQR